VYTADDALVLYNKFNVSYSTAPTVPDNPPPYPNFLGLGYDCVVAARNTTWKVVQCSGQHHVVCQQGLTLQTNNASPLFACFCVFLCLSSFDSNTILVSGNRPRNAEKISTRKIK